jgi:hypothetical protein
MHQKLLCRLSLEIPLCLLYPSFYGIKIRGLMPNISLILSKDPWKRSLWPSSKRGFICLEFWSLSSFITYHFSHSSIILSPHPYPSTFPFLFISPSSLFLHIPYPPHHILLHPPFSVIPPSTSLLLSTFPSPHLHILFQHGKKRCEATHLCITLIFHLCIHYISLVFPHLPCTLPNENSTYHNMTHGKKHNMTHGK